MTRILTSDALKFSKFENRKKEEVTSLQRKYEKRPLINLYVKKLIALAFVPPAMLLKYLEYWKSK